MFIMISGILKFIFPDCLKPPKLEAKCSLLISLCDEFEERSEKHQEQQQNSVQAAQTLDELKALASRPLGGHLDPRGPSVFRARYELEIFQRKLDAAAMSTSVSLEYLP
ncbi:MAG: hypothetical protein ACU0CA_14165 [Paracoccaceae bacterium]